MDFKSLLAIVGDEPVFETSLLLAGRVDPDLARQQLSRWTKNGRLYQLRRGLYALAPPYQKVKPHPFLIANRMQPASYVSRQSALAYYGLIPETTYAMLSVTGGRPARWRTPLGDFDFRHVRAGLLTGYRMLDLGGGQSALVASPEKALLDLVYLQPGGEAPGYLGELRLQNLERLDLETLRRQAQVFAMPRMMRAAAEVERLARAEAVEFETL
jgi:hypothetical protein